MRWTLHREAVHPNISLRYLLYWLTWLGQIVSIDASVEAQLSILNLTFNVPGLEPPVSRWFDPITGFVHAISHAFLHYGRVRVNGSYCTQVLNSEETVTQNVRLFYYNTFLLIPLVWNRINRPVSVIHYRYSF